MSWLALEGKTAVVTGGASGIGKAVVQAFLDNGANVVVCDMNPRVPEYDLKDGSGEYFTDHEFHDYLEREQIEREPKTEWFHADGMMLLSYFLKFAGKKPSASAEKCTYELRREQEEAAAMTAAYFAGGGTEFLWNAKPRFGKTLTAYDLICRTGRFYPPEDAGY